MIKAEIITVGTEIMLGQVIDTNAQYIAKTFAEKGLQCVFKTSVSDDAELLKSVLEIAKDRVDLIVITGGLGPTENDKTREVVADFSGVQLIQGKEIQMQAQKCSEIQQEIMVKGLLKQSQIPEGAVVIPNNYGTAVGFILKYREIEIVCLPGVPREMKPMLRKYIEICLFLNTQQNEFTCIRNMHTFGISEPEIDHILKNISSSEEQTKTMTLVHDGIVTIHLQATATVREDAQKLLYSTESNLRKKLGYAIFGVDDESLESAVAKLLRIHKKTIATAESCTGGLVSDRLTNIPGISEFFLEGIVSYSNKAKIDLLGVPHDLIRQFGAVSPQVAKAMAKGIKKRAPSHIGVGITGIAGPTGATNDKPIGLVYISVITDDAYETKECRFKGTRIDIKRFSVNTALNMVRLALIKEE